MTIIVAKATTHDETEREQAQVAIGLACEFDGEAKDAIADQKEGGHRTAPATSGPS